MAKRNTDAVALKDTEASTKALRAETIRDVCKEISSLEAQREVITDKISEIRQTKIKGRLGMKMADFGMAYRLYKLDHEDRDDLFSTLHECFTALGVGDQLSFLDAVDRAGGHVPDTGPGVDHDGFDTGAQSSVTDAEAYNAGEAAARDGKGLDGCPYDAMKHKSLVKQWQTGWSDGRAEAAGNVTPIATAKSATGRRRKSEVLTELQPMSPAAEAALKDLPTVSEWTDDGFQSVARYEESEL